jgi:hypothetical protein
MEVAKLILRTFIGLGVVLALGVLSYHLFNEGNGWGWVSAGGAVMLGMELWESLQPDSEQKLRKASKSRNKARAVRKRETAKNNAATRKAAPATRNATTKTTTSRGTHTITTTTKGRMGARTVNTSIQRKPVRKPRTVRV